MDYHAIYHRLIDRAANRQTPDAVERHHIIPRCMGGSDAKSNIALLTPEEHFFAHVILVKLHPDVPKLILAVNMMGCGHRGKRARKIYGWLKRKHAEYMSQLQSGKNNSAYGLRWITNGIVSKRVCAEDGIPDGWVFGRAKKAKNRNPGPGRGFKPNALRFRADAGDLLRRYESGESTKVLGQELGVSGKAITQFLNYSFPNRRKYAPRQKRALVV